MDRSTTTTATTTKGKSIEIKKERDYFWNRRRCSCCLSLCCVVLCVFICLRCQRRRRIRRRRRRQQKQEDVNGRMIYFAFHSSTFSVPCFVCTSCGVARTSTSWVECGEGERATQGEPILAGGVERCDQRCSSKKLVLYLVIQRKMIRIDTCFLNMDVVGRIRASRRPGSFSKSWSHFFRRAVAFGKYSSNKKWVAIYVLYSIWRDSIRSNSFFIPFACVAQG